MNVNPKQPPPVEPGDRSAERFAALERAARLDSSLVNGGSSQNAIPTVDHTKIAPGRKGRMILDPTDGNLYMDTGTAWTFTGVPFASGARTAAAANSGASQLAAVAVQGGTGYSPLASLTLAGGAATPGMVLFLCWGNWINGSGSDQKKPSFRYRLHGNAIWSSGFGPLIATTEQNVSFSWHLQFWVTNQALRKQSVSVLGEVGGATAGDGVDVGEGSYGASTGTIVGRGTAAVDMRSDVLFELFVKNASSSASYETDLANAVLIRL